MTSAWDWMPITFATGPYGSISICWPEPQASLSMAEGLIKDHTIYADDRRLTMASINCQVAIIGAGPYGLSAAAHLRAAQTEVRIFGKPMDFWRNGMPDGMVLRSPWIYC